MNGAGQSAAPALSDSILAAARNVRAVLEGRSLSDSLAQTPAAVRASAQAISFHTMRRLGHARAVRAALVQRTPADPLLDALLLVSLSLLETACAVRDAAGAQAPSQRQAPHQAGSDGQGAAGIEGRSDVAAGAAARERGLPVYAVHTVVDQAVSAAAGNRGLQAGKGMVNGVLRNYLRQRDALLATLASAPEARWNFPAWWVRRLKADYPGQWQALLTASDVPGPMTLRVNRRRQSVEGLLDCLAQAGIGARAVGAYGVVLDQPRPVYDVPGFDEGWWSVQDAAAQMAAPLLAPRDGMRVLDACAAPGGKTAHLLELADVHLLALDNDEQRLQRVADNLERLGLDDGPVFLCCADAADLDAWWDGEPFDAVLADVPCTASGVVRRHPDIRWLRREADVARTAALQRRIVDALWRTVRPGGHLLYATCSVFPQECEAQARAFASRWPDAERLPAPGQLLPTDAGRLTDGQPVAAAPGGAPGSAQPMAESGLYDGFFYALFAKRG